MGISKSLYVGIDIHSKLHVAAIIPTTLLENSDTLWRKVQPLVISNCKSDFAILDEAIREYTLKSDDVAIAIDHTGGHYSEPLVYFLDSKGYNVYHLESKAVKAARERLLDQESKSDVIDAIGSAYLLYLSDVHGISFRISRTTPQLRSKASFLNTLVLQRWLFKKLIIQVTNRLHHLLIATFPEGESQCFTDLLKIIHKYPSPESILESNDFQTEEVLTNKAKEKLVDLAKETVGIRNNSYTRLIRELAKQRNKAIIKCDDLTETIRREVKSHPYGEVLLSFPQLGEIAAATIIGVIKDISLWSNKKKLRKALGVYNSRTQSGLSLGKSRYGREGSRSARRVLFQVCFGCVRKNVSDNDFKDYYLRNVAKGKPRKMALVNTMGKLAEIIFHCLKAGELYRYHGTYSSENKIQDSP